MNGTSIVAGSARFSAVELEGQDRDEANAQAAVKLRNRQGFYRVDYMLLEISAAERLPRRLSWRERITGKLCAQ